MKTSANHMPFALSMILGLGCLGLITLLFLTDFPAIAQEENQQLAGKIFSDGGPAAQPHARPDQPGLTTGPSQATTELAVDDGSVEAAVGLSNGGTVTAVNRLTPTSYPATMTSVLLFFQTQQGLPPASPITILVGTNPSGGANINNVTFTQQISAFVETAGSYYLYQVTPVTINSGDFVVGFRATHAAGQLPLAIDRTGPRNRRSYVSTGGTTLTILDDAIPSVAGNFLIRARLQGQPPGCPTVSGVNPPGGAVGSQVTITGNNFNGVTSVRFTNNAAAQFTINSNTQITAMVPQGAVTGPITIGKPNCPDVQTSPFAVNTGSSTELAVDDGTFETGFGLSGGGTSWRVNRLTPTSYPATLNAVSIFFRATSNLTVGSPLTIVYAAHPSGGTSINGLQLQTMESAIQSLGQFNVYNVPALTINSGDFVVGYKITHAADVFPYALDTTPPSQRRSYRSLDGVAFQIIDDIPQTTAGNYGIRARLQGQTQPCPAVIGVSPTSGAAGSQATITGSNFTGVSAVRFANNVSANFTVNSDTQITATVPNGAVTGPITISKPNCPDVTTPSFTVTSSCTYSINPTSQSFPASGGSGSVAVNTQAGCSWMATSNASFIMITGGSSGNGSGAVNYTVGANTGASRTGTITVAGQTFTVNQGSPAPASWARLTSGATNTLRSVHFTSESVGYAAGEQATLLRTTNSGATWTAITNTGVEPSRGFATVRFLDQNTGWAGGASAVARTLDGGANWMAMTLPSTDALVDNAERRSYFPISTTQAWSGGVGTRGGNTDGFVLLYNLSTSGQLTRGFEAATSDPVRDLHFIDAGNGWVIGDDGLILRVQNGGFGGFQGNTFEHLNGIHMLNGTTGWIAGDNGSIFRTRNSGGLWTKLNSGTTARLRDVHFANENTGWAVGDGGLILTTTNGGDAWTPETSGVTENLHSVFFVNPNAGYAVGANGAILKRGSSAVGSLASVSAASFLGAELAAESIVAAFGQNLATTTQVAPGLPLPIELAGTTAKVRDSAGVVRLAGVLNAASAERPAALFFVAPTQVNYQIPPGTAAGAATVTITSGSGAVSAGTVNIANVAPGLFTANASGQGVAAAVVFRRRADGSESFEPVARFDPAQSRFVTVPVDLGPETDQVFLILYGVGFRFRSSLSATTVTIGGVNSEVLFAGDAPGFVGLDQANVRLSRSLIGRGEVDVVLTVDGKMANTVRAAIK